VTPTFSDPDVFHAYLDEAEAHGCNAIQALIAGEDRREAIYAAYQRFYRGDIAVEIRARHARAWRPVHRGAPGHARGW
jgi:IS5 family transposase